MSLKSVLWSKKCMVMFLLYVKKKKKTLTQECSLCNIDKIITPAFWVIQKWIKMLVSHCVWAGTETVASLGGFLFFFCFCLSGTISPLDGGVNKETSDTQTKQIHLKREDTVSSLNMDYYYFLNKPPIFFFLTKIYYMYF